MTPAEILIAVLRFGPSILPVIQQISGWIKEGKTEVTEADIALLVTFANKKPEDYGLPPAQPPSP